MEQVDGDGEEASQEALIIIETKCEIAEEGRLPVLLVGRLLLLEPWSNLLLLSLCLSLR